MPDLFNAFGLMSRHAHKMTRDARKRPMSPSAGHTALVSRPRAKHAHEQFQADKKAAVKAETRRDLMARAQTQVSHLNRRMDKIERHPSKRGIVLLNEIIRSRTTPDAERVRASDILLRWATGDFTNGKQRRGPKPRADKQP